MHTTTPNRVSHSYTQSLIAPPEEIFPLLCPVREAEWVPGWDPELVISESGVAELDCVFITQGAPNNSIWVVTRYEPESYLLEMLKITPGLTVGKLEIKLAAKDDGKTAAEVAYTYTSLGPRGDAFLDEFTTTAYRGFMETWERELNHYLSTGSKIED